MCIFLEYAVARHLQYVISMGYLTAVLYCISFGVKSEWWREPGWTIPETDQGPDDDARRNIRFISIFIS